MVQKAKTLSDWLQSQATQTEAANRIPEHVVERLATTGLFRMMKPPRFGGLGCTPREAWEAVFEVGKGCGSCAWIVGFNSPNVLMLGKFSEQAQRDVLLCGKPAIVSILTGGVDSGLEPCVSRLGHSRHRKQYTWRWREFWLRRISLRQTSQFQSQEHERKSTETLYACDAS